MTSESMCTETESLSEALHQFRNALFVLVFLAAMQFTAPALLRDGLVVWVLTLFLTVTSAIWLLVVLDSFTSVYKHAHRDPRTREAAGIADFLLGAALLYGAYLVSTWDVAPLVMDSEIGSSIFEPWFQGQLLHFYGMVLKAVGVGLPAVGGAVAIRHGVRTVFPDGSSLWGGSHE
jgi:hypothetical protein